MQHKYAVDAVNRTLQDILGRETPFCGISVLFGDDFRQTLPVIPHGSRQQVVAASIRRSTLWNNVEIHHLHENMCLEQSPEMQDFVNWLLDIGAGNGLDESETISIPQRMIYPDFSVDMYLD